MKPERSEFQHSFEQQPNRQPSIVDVAIAFAFDLDLVSLRVELVAQR